jgi:hypothetical protein
MGKLKNLPPFKELKRNYLGPSTSPLSVSEVGQIVGGKVKTNIADPAQPDYKNTCTIRVSRSLNYSNQPVQRIAEARVNSGADKKWYIYSVLDFRAYMERIYGPPDITRKGKPGKITEADFLGKQGIIVFGTAHADLWDGATCVNHCLFLEVGEVLLWEAGKATKP